MFGELRGRNNIHGLNHKARCLTAVPGDTENARFLIGTMGLKEDNEVHLLQVEDDGMGLEIVSVFPHTHEIWHLAPSPVDKDLFFTCAHRVAEEATTVTTLWEMDHDLCQLRERCTLEGENINKLEWNPDGTKAATLDAASLAIWTLEDGAARQQQTVPLGELTSTPARAGSVTSGRWFSLKPDQFAFAHRRDVVSYDSRSNRAAFQIENAHGIRVRDLDFNAYKRTLCTGGDDCGVALWDLRNVSEPLMSCQMHSHWVWNVRFNPCHEPLLLTSSTDSYVNLLDVAPALRDPSADASAASSSSDGASSNGKPVSAYSKDDWIVKTFDEHEDSVYAVAWSTVHPWVFASLSYDGRAVSCCVPQDVQYRMLYRI